MKKLIIILLMTMILYVLVGCQNKEAMAELEAFKTQAIIEEKNMELAGNLIGEFNKGNVDIWRELCASEFAYYNPSETTEPMSLEQTIERFQMLYVSFPDYSWNIRELIAKGDRVIARTNFTGTHEKEYGRFVATGNKLNLSIISIFRFKDGKCIEVLEEEDSLGLMRQFGMELKPKEDE
ncbi:ester cyclase [Candidatus Dojkabacteria bacterium]|nr:ester cyclase [Candidatus Dojkabacteria bacterium]